MACKWIGLVERGYRTVFVTSFISAPVGGTFGTFYSQCFDNVILAGRHQRRAIGDDGECDTSTLC